MNQILDLLFGVWRDSPLKKKTEQGIIERYTGDEMQILSISPHIFTQYLTRKKEKEKNNLNNPFS